MEFKPDEGRVTKAIEVSEDIFELHLYDTREYNLTYVIVPFRVFC